MSADNPFIARGLATGDWSVPANFFDDPVDTSAAADVAEERRMFSDAAEAACLKQQLLESGLGVTAVPPSLLD